MPELKAYALTCPGCGAALKVGESVTSFACAYCGASVRVERGDGIVSLRLLTDAISNVQRGTDRTAAELAIRRLTREIGDAGTQLNQIKERIQGFEGWAPTPGRTRTLADLQQQEHELQVRLNDCRKKLAEARAIVDS